MDASLVDQKIVKFISNSLNCEANNNDVRISTEKSVFCSNFLNIPKPRSYALSSNISGFCSKIRAYQIKENFSHNGFDGMEFIYLQMFTKYPLNNERLKNDLHIYDEATRCIILNQLKKGIIIHFELQMLPI